MTSDLSSIAKDTLRDCAKYVLFDKSGAVLAANYQPQPAELQSLSKVLDDRDSAIKNGMTIDGQRYEVHRFHPPLAYGRTMGCAPEASVGAALCMVQQGLSGQPCFGVITYNMPNLSARMVPILQQLCEQHLKAK
ncbi:hypothetical protein OEZ85_009839 [Tetradesmus obliquus]|uniref:Profilin n=1 Tax=Tetradesmus obliquus TaxID=3088 RepID=A0ABY8UDC7_TETOB|nr:hypothetical protein OEZ85_009839 [Tetradesmus obliquus]